MLKWGSKESDEMQAVHIVKALLPVTLENNSELDAGRLGRRKARFAVSLEFAKSISECVA